MKILLMVIAAALSACATSSPYPLSYRRDGASPESLRIEAAQCRVQAMSGSAAIRDGIVGYTAAKSIYRDCMIGKGWQETPGS